MKTKAFLEFESVTCCPACGASEIRVVVESQIAQCFVCRVFFRNPRPTQAEIARSYETGATFAAWQEEEEARAAMWGKRLALVRRYQPAGRLLDVGTGDGRFLFATQACGYRGLGTEVSEAGAAYARERGCEVRMGQITEMELPNEQFDVATIWHVLEHVPNPGEVLRKVHSLLRPGGILAVAVPNEEHYFVHRKIGQAHGSPFDPLQFGSEIHLTYFQPATLRTALRRAGFEVLEFGVDDIYLARGRLTGLKLGIQKLLARLFGWHFAVAMYVVCRRNADKTGQ